MTSDRPEKIDLSGSSLLGGRVQLIQRLGAGAFGAVYRARQFAMGRPMRTIAVKLTHRTGLTPENAKEEVQEAFTIASIAAQCRDPSARLHLIQVYDAGLADDLDGRAYLVLEFVSGVQLQRHLQSYGPNMPLTTVRRYFAQICRALGACHSHDPPITHGDLKPDNLLVDDTQTIRIVDFGLARPLDRLTGYAINPGGALAYCAPETLLGKGYPQSDIYSLGLIMYEMLAADGPHLHFERNDDGDPGYSYYKQKFDCKFPLLESCYRGLDSDPELFRIVEKCCSFHVEDRFSSIAELLEALTNTSTSKGPGCEPAPLEEETVTTIDPDASDFSESGNPVTSDDWLVRIDRHYQLGDYEGGLCYLESLKNPPGEATAYRSAMLARSGDARQALTLGMPLLTSRKIILPGKLTAILIDALIFAADGLPDASHYAAYLRDLRSRGAT